MHASRSTSSIFSITMVKTRELATDKEENPSRVGFFQVGFILVCGQSIIFSFSDDEPSKFGPLYCVQLSACEPIDLVIIATISSMIFNFLFTMLQMFF